MVIHGGRISLFYDRNTMVNFFCLGSNRLPIWAALISLFAFPSFSQVDVEILAELQYVSQTLETELDLINEKLYSDGYSVADLSAQILESVGNTEDYAYSISQVLDEASTTEYVGLRTYEVVPGNTSGFRTFDPIVADLVQRIYKTDTTVSNLVSRGCGYLLDIDNILAQQTNQLNRVVSAIYSLTNSFNSSSPGQVVFNDSMMTNLPALLMYNLSDWGSRDYRDLFLYFYGRYPTESELTRFTFIASRLGLRNYLWEGLSSFISYYSLPLDLQLLMDDVYTVYNWNYEDPALDNFSQAYYYQYGTRPLYETFEAWTNKYREVSAEIISLLESLDSRSGERTEIVSRMSRRVANIENIMIAITNGTVQVFNSDGKWTAEFTNQVTIAMEEAEEFTGTVNDDVATVNTNDIVPIEDSGYVSRLRQLERSTPDDNENMQSLLAKVNDTSLFDDLSEALQEGVGTDDYIFTFNLPNYFPLHPIRSSGFAHTQEVKIKVSDQTSGLYNLFSSARTIFKAVVFLVLCWSIYGDVVGLTHYRLRSD